MVTSAASGSRKYERSPSYIFFLRLLSVVGVWLYWSWHCFVSVFGCLPVDVRYLLAADWFSVLMLIFFIFLVLYVIDR